MLLSSESSATEDVRVGQMRQFRKFAALRDLSALLKDKVSFDLLIHVHLSAIVTKCTFSFVVAKREIGIIAKLLKKFTMNASTIQSITTTTMLLLLLFSF